jgi:hypothetical protein
MTMRPIRCLECYRKRPGGRCDFCPLHRKNRHLYRSIGGGWFVKKEETGQEPKEDKRDTR